MNIRLACLGALAALSACATGSQPALTGPVKDVATRDYLQYWRVRPDSLTQYTDIPHENGCMRVQVTIDSEGKIASSKLLAVVGPDFPAWIPKLLAGLRYDPAPGNTARTAIRTVLPWTFSYSVNSGAASEATSAAAIQARAAASPSPEVLEWTDKCRAEMDKQMGISTAPVAATVSHR